ncbi:CLUMA_CG002921, isoform A [Clunio marinus]|uniref:CLUMA_CG002921, isoform A n=1 Tax=Clunio marinus TaxID=568069 RepID=A0A1J1HM59_9DIPT|nr:CLUMA_CG002921, isoform A [Clunio marinus]
MGEIVTWSGINYVDRHDNIHPPGELDYNMKHHTNNEESDKKAKHSRHLLYVLMFCIREKFQDKVVNP